MNIGERVACIETKLVTIERLLYVILAGLGFQVSSNILPIVISPLL